MPHLEAFFNPWLVVICSSFSAGISASYVQTSHLFVLPIREMFHVSYRDASLIPCLSLSMLFLGLIANTFFHQFGYRRSIMGAAVLCTFSQVCAAFTTKYWLMVVLLGLLNGLGVSVLFNGPVLVAGYLFTDRDRHKAMAIVYAGVGAGLMLMPILFEILAQAYSFRGCLIMLAGLTFQIVLAGSVMPDKLVFENHDRKYSRGTSKAAEARRKYLKDQEANGTADIALIEEEPTSDPTLYQRFLDSFRPQLLKDWRLQLLNGASFFFAVILAVMSSFNESILIVDYNLSLTERTAIVAAGGAASTLGRLAVGLFPKTKVVPRWWIWSLDGLIEGLSIALLGLLPEAGVGGAAFAQILCGFTLGFIFTMHAVVLSDVFPAADFGAAYGFNTFVMMVASLVSPIFSGWLGDVTNSFRIPLYIAGFSQMIGFSFPLAGLFIYRMRGRYRIRRTSQMAKAVSAFYALSLTKTVL